MENKSFLFCHLKEAPFVTVFAGIGLNTLLYLTRASKLLSDSIQFVFAGVSSLHKPLLLVVLGTIIAKMSLNFKRGLMVNSGIAVVDDLFILGACSPQAYSNPGSLISRFFAYFSLYSSRQ